MVQAPSLELIAPDLIKVSLRGLQSERSLDVGCHTLRVIECKNAVIPVGISLLSEGSQVRNVILQFVSSKIEKVCYSPIKLVLWLGSGLAFGIRYEFGYG